VRIKMKVRLSIRDPIGLKQHAKNSKNINPQLFLRCWFSFGTFFVTEPCYSSIMIKADSRHKTRTLFIHSFYLYTSHFTHSNALTHTHSHTHTHTHTQAHSLSQTPTNTNTHTHPLTHIYFETHTRAYKH